MSGYFKRILAIGAHHDDVELGCGGSLLRWKAEGAAITIFTACNSGYSDASGKTIRANEVAKMEGEAAAEKLGASLVCAGFPTFELEFNESLNRKVLSVLESAPWDLVLTHWDQDTHHDHRALALATLHCSRKVPRLLMYRSNSYASAKPFHANYFVDISETFREKQNLVRLFKSEHERTAGVWDKWMQAEATLYGLQSQCEAAEGFSVVKWRH